MTELNTLQQEFENLIDQLDSLKSINELTTRNSDATTALLSGIEGFITELQGFQQKITGSYSKLSDSVDDQTEHLKEAVGSLERKTDEFNAFIDQNFNKLYDKYEAQVLAKIRQMAEEVTTRAKEMSDNVSGTNREMAEQVNAHTAEMKEDLEAKTRAISEEISRRNEELTTQVTNRSQEMVEKLDTYAGTIDSFDGRVKQLEQSLTERQTEMEKEIRKVLNELGHEMEAQAEKAHQTKVEMMEKTKVTNILLMVIIGLVVIGFAGVIWMGMA